MSAIWGAIDLSGNELDGSVLDKMKKAFEFYSIDRFEAIKENTVLMGCGIQYFNKEAYVEKLPISRDGYYLDADLVLDNREDLFEKLGLSPKEDEIITDGELLFELLIKYGKGILNDLLGAYAFVFYDANKNELMLVGDSVGNRTLYYKRLGNIVYYSSLLEGITAASESRLNDRWFLEFLAMDFTPSYTEQEMTPYQEIYRVPTASSVVCTLNGLNKNRYWNPLDDLSIKKYKNDSEVEKEFKKLWQKAVRSVMRTEDEVSILLSGGLDSTSVASEASPYLKDKRRTLYSFTSVPIEQYESERGYRIDDETEDVLKTAEYYGNIVPEFMKLEGINSWNGYMRQMRVFENPYKASLNAMWMQEACLKARKNNSRLLLTGGYGNNCLSYSGVQRYCNYLFENFHWIKLYKILSGFSSSIGLSRKNAIKGIFKDAFLKAEIPTDVYFNSYVNRKFAADLGIDKKLEQSYRYKTENEHKANHRYEVMVDWIGMRQIGELTMKLSLYSGVLIRDPSIDKRLIEFCVHLPMEQFDKDGIDRRLVKYYLRDQIPEHVNRFVGRGRQSADMKLRVELEWNRIYKEWLQIYNDNRDNKYVDVDKAIGELREKPDIIEYEGADINRHIYTIGVLLFCNEKMI